MRATLVELAEDHPGFHDPEYRARRDEIAQLAIEHGVGTQAPRVQYTEQETRTWSTIFDALMDLYPTHACREHCEAFGALGYRRDAIPQLADVSAQLRQRTGFRLEPVAGLVSSREFLAALGERVFLCTQYLRHHTRPHYTPEPDVVHELMGHAPMLGNGEFAELSQRLGRAALGASDEVMRQIGTLYWYTVEYGVVRQDEELRAFGAGLLSSSGELARALRGGADVRSLDTEVAANLPYPITQYQPVLFEVPSIREAFARIDRVLRH
jgi:phenylalanine-4-hydroxylase